MVGSKSPLANAIVLAAGKSTRIASISEGLPKPLIPIEGEPILVRNLRWLAGEGVTRVWINLHYRGELIRNEIGDGRRFGLQTNYVDEPEILGTAGAVKNIARQWTSTAVVVYGDNLIETNLTKLLEGHRASEAAVTIGLFDRRLHPHSGMAGGRVELGKDGRIRQFREGVGDDISPLVNAGVYLLEPSAIKQIPEGKFVDFGRDLFPKMLTEGQFLNGTAITGYCLGIDTPESYNTALKLISEGKVKLQ